MFKRQNVNVELNNLYTLKNSQKHRDSPDFESLNSFCRDLQENSSNANNEDEQQKDTEAQLQIMTLKYRRLQDMVKLQEQRDAKHEQKQKELIKKMSYLQVTNKQLNFEVKKMANNVKTAKQQAEQTERKIQAIEKKTAQVERTGKKITEERKLFLKNFRQALKILSKCQSKEQYRLQYNNILKYCDCNLQYFQGVAENSSLVFEPALLETLKLSNKGMTEQIERLQTELNHERQDRRKIITVYNEKIQVLKNQYGSLKHKVEEQNNIMLGKMKQALRQKDKTIRELQNILREENKKKTKNKKSYIGDGRISFERYEEDYEGQYQSEHTEKRVGENQRLNQLNQEIQELEKQIICQFKEGNLE